MICFDTNVAIELLGDRAPAVRRRFDDARSTGAAMGLSIVVYHELMMPRSVSAARTTNGRSLCSSRRGIAVVQLREDDAHHAADIRAHLKRLGAPIGPYDVLIAAQARRAGDPLVTANEREFERVPGLNSRFYLDMKAGSPSR